MLRYKSDMPLPPHAISLFIVKHNEQIIKEKGKYQVWRYGVVLRDCKGTIALVREDDRTISVSVKGKHRTAYISVLRETLNDIFNCFKSEKPDLQYRVESSVTVFEDLWLSGNQIMANFQKNIPYPHPVTGQLLPMSQTVNNYMINGDNIMMKGNNNTFVNDYSLTTFNIRDCNIGLQGNFNELAQLLKENGNEQEENEMNNIAEALEKVEDAEGGEIIRKNGVAGRIRRFVEEISDENNSLHKTIKGIKHGVSIAQDIADKYNDFAQWLGMPQVPRPFLKK